MDSKKKLILVLVVFIIAAGIISLSSYDKNKTIQAQEHMQDVVVTVDDCKLTLEDMMFYIAYEETSVQKQAHIYSPDDPGAYWNLHVDGQFVKVVARKATMDMAVHDEIFYQLACVEDMTLDEEEQQLLDSKVSDFWTDLSEEERERICVDKARISQTMTHLALAQKYQTAISKKSGITYDAYNIEGEAYKAILEKHEVEINTSIWNRLSFGDIIINKYE